MVWNWLLKKKSKGESGEGESRVKKWRAKNKIRTLSWMWKYSWAKNGVKKFEK